MQNEELQQKHSIINKSQVINGDFQIPQINGIVLTSSASKKLLPTVNDTRTDLMKAIRDGKLYKYI